MNRSFFSRDEQFSGEEFLAKFSHAQELPWGRSGSECWTETRVRNPKPSKSELPHHITHPLLTFNTLHLKNGKRMTTVSSSTTTASLSATHAATAAAP